jgi:hypothetical protein
MTPKEKAIELYEKFYYQLPSDLMDKVQDCTAYECALIAVDEVLFVLNEIDSTEQWNASWFYNQVKQEIEKL